MEVPQRNDFPNFSVGIGLKLDSKIWKFHKENDFPNSSVGIGLK
jgi:hypothetical protein